MDNLEFNIEWLEPEAVEGQELSATWCRLVMTLNNESIVQLYDKKTGSVRNSLYLPAYILAEWLAENYWFINYEFDGQCKEKKDYDSRHNVYYSREGYLFPKMSIQPFRDDLIHIILNKTEYGNEGKEFIHDQELICARTVFVNFVDKFIQMVLARLRDKNVENSYLEELWSDISTYDKEEREYARIIASLGEYEYDIDDAVAQWIIESSHKFSGDTFYNISSSLLLSEFRESLPVLLEIIDKLYENAVKQYALPQLKNELNRNLTGGTPWDEGYQLAKALRSLTGTSESVFRNVLDINNKFGLSESNSEDITLKAANIGGFESALYTGEDDKIKIAYRSGRRDTSKMFSYCRALSEYFTTEKKGIIFISDMESWNQKRNRAFAAELLAPVLLLKENVAKQWVDEDDLYDLAMKFSVSEYVIKYQLINQTNIRVIRE